jgi:Cu(I)/Ag(I) efflux system membrane fusion protein
MASLAKWVLTVAISAALGAVGYAWYARQAAPNAAGPAPEASGAGERRILYWYDPMVPQHRFDKPGNSPFMDMDLVPKYADEEEAGSVSIDPRTVQNIGVRIAPVEQGALAATVEAPGIVRADETRTVVVQSRVGGYIESQPVRSLDQPVARGQVLLTLTSPELIAAQQELLLARQAGDDALAAAGRERLALMGMTQQYIARVEAERRPIERVPVVAPQHGFVAELNARLGMTVMPGAPLATITSLATIWVVAEVPEREAAEVAPGSKVAVEFAALPGRAYEGRVDYLYPQIGGEARTLRARIPLANPHGLLRPGMLARVRFMTKVGSKRPLVPTEALIETGRRTVVIVADGQGRFTPVEVRTGAEAGDRTEILEGLNAGQKVVVSGQFLIDSEASLKSALARLETTRAAAPEGDRHRMSGRVNSVDREAGKLNISHGPVESLSMPGMTMNFPVENRALLDRVGPGEEAEFEFRVQGSDFVITGVTPRKRK